MNNGLKLFSWLKWIFKQRKFEMHPNFLYLIYKFLSLWERKSRRSFRLKLNMSQSWVGNLRLHERLDNTGLQRMVPFPDSPPYGTSWNFIHLCRFYFPAILSLSARFDRLLSLVWRFDNIFRWSSCESTQVKLIVIKPLCLQTAIMQGKKVRELYRKAANNLFNLNPV